MAWYDIGHLNIYSSWIYLVVSIHFSNNILSMPRHWRCSLLGYWTISCCTVVRYSFKCIYQNDTQRPEQCFSKCSIWRQELNIFKHLRGHTCCRPRLTSFGKMLYLNHPLQRIAFSFKIVLADPLAIKIGTELAVYETRSGRVYTTIPLPVTSDTRRHPHRVGAENPNDDNDIDKNTEV